MEMTLNQAKAAILNAFISFRLREVRTTLHSVNSDHGDTFKTGPTTKQIADYLETSPPRVMRHFQPLMDDRTHGELIGGVDEGGYRWWYKGMRQDLINARPDLEPAFRASGHH